MECLVDVIVDEKEYKLFSGFVGTSITLQNDATCKLDKSIKYNIIGDKNLLDQYHKYIANTKNMEDIGEYYNYENNSDNEEHDEEEYDEEENDEKEHNEEEHDEEQSEGEQDEEKDEEEDEIEISEFHRDVIRCVIKHKSDHIYDYRPVLSVYFTKK